MWPNAIIDTLDGTKECVAEILSGKIDGALLSSYTAQKLARNDTQNRLSVDIVPVALVNRHMGVNAKDNYNFYGLWDKTLKGVSTQSSYKRYQGSL